MVVKVGADRTKIESYKLYDAAGLEINGTSFTAAFTGKKWNNETQNYDEFTENKTVVIKTGYSGSPTFYVDGEYAGSAYIRGEENYYANTVTGILAGKPSTPTDPPEENFH